ncbi:MAG: tyrosine-type recombinase/integrase [Desulfovibrionaceae bacterium]|nr:tyrosine-type recombinase/integrase [Desulfovibrionaceae bacterium]
MRGKNYQVSVYRNGIRKTCTVETIEQALLIHHRLTIELEQAQQAVPLPHAQSHAVPHAQPHAVPHARSKGHSRAEAWTLATALERTIPLLWAGKGCERTAVINAKSAVAFFGPDTSLADIDLEWIDEYVDALLAQGNSGSTVNRKLSALSSMLRVAFERGKIEHLPKMPRRKEGEHRIRFLSVEEEARLLHYMRDVLGRADHADAVEVLLYTGVRCGELWRLETRDIDLERGTMTLWKTKNGRPRTIPIVARIRPIIERRMVCAKEGKIFPEGSHSWLRTVWDKARLDLGYAEDSQFVPHMLRHTCATRLAQRGISMPIIKEWMGHTTIQTTARYAHFSPTDLERAASLLGQE